MRNTNIEKLNVQNAICNNQRDYSRSINNIFSKDYRDQDLFIVEILSLLIAFPILSLGEIRKYMSLPQRKINDINKLVKAKCVKIYDYNSPEFLVKSQLMTNLYEKARIIKCIKDIENVQNGGHISIEEMREISYAYYPRKTETLIKVPHNLKLVEITEKGKLVLAKFLKLYTTFFNYSILRKDLGIIDNIDTVKKELSIPLLRTNSGLFTKTVDELKNMVKSVGIEAVLLQSNDNENKNNGTNVP